MKTRLAVFAILSTFAVGTIAAEAINPQNEKAEKMFRSSFRTDNPKQWMNRLNQDETMSLCSKFKDHPPQKVREKIEANQTTTIRYPVDGNLVGDRHEGEALASSGKGGHIGFIQPDKAGTPRGGNCYACHQLAPREPAFGTIGPSLQYFGKTRGNSEEIVKYTYDKIYNSNAFNACSSMPRFGYHNWLTPEQITHLVAFLLDPESPVNREQPPKP